MYKPIKYKPIIIFVAKIENKEQQNVLENMLEELFLYTMDEGHADTSSILLVSLIKDYEEKTETLVVPSTNTDPRFIEYADNTQFTNNIIVDTILHSDSLFYFEITDAIKIYNKPLNLWFLSSFYRI